MRPAPLERRAAGAPRLREAAERPRSEQRGALACRATKSARCGCAIRPSSASSAAALDGDWSFEDTDAAYFLLDSVALGEDTAGAASLLFADFAHYFSQRKERERFCLLFADEFSAIAQSSDVAIKVEQARGFNAAMVLVPQTPSGMGSRTQRDRILGSVETVILHALNEPDELAAAGRNEAGDRADPSLRGRRLRPPGPCSPGAATEGRPGRDPRPCRAATPG